MKRLALLGSTGSIGRQTLEVVRWHPHEFSVVALVLAVVGIYGALAYSVAQRRAELGIRLALGAEKSDILRLVVGQGLLLTGVGIGIGVVLGLVAGKLFSDVMSGLLYRVKTLDVTTFVLTPVVFLLIGGVASFFPAYRATKVDPTEAIRNRA